MSGSCRLAGNARAAGVWLVAEHGARHPRAAAILAHMASNFADQVTRLIYYISSSLSLKRNIYSFFIQSQLFSHEYNPIILRL